MRQSFNPEKLVKAAWWMLLLLVLIGVIFIRVRLLDIPLERDEGEYAYAGQLMLQGIPPYKLAYNLKFPGTYAAYALIMSILGQSTRGIHLGLLVINLLAVAMIFLLGRRLVNSLTGIAAAAAYAVLSVIPGVLGSAAHATNFVVLPVLAGTLLLLARAEPERLPRLFVSGALFGIGLLMKQPAVFFVLFGALSLLAKDLRATTGWERVLVRQSIFASGVILPIGLTVLLLWQAGVFDKFWFWTINYAGQYASLVSFRQAGQLFLQSSMEAIAGGWALWSMAGVGLIIGLRDDRTRASTGFLATLLTFSALAVIPGFCFRQHYFVLVLPAVALLAGVAVNSFARLLTNSRGLVQLIPPCLFAAALILPVAAEKRFFFSLSPVEACREIYSGSPFPESIEIAKFIREHTRPEDTIAVLGSEPEIYFYAKRHSATGYIYTYGLMEEHKYARNMQLEMIREIESARPKYLVTVVVNNSWLERPGSQRLIFDWANDYAARNYTAVGFINLAAHNRTDYYFGAIPESVPRLGNYILIYERKS